MVTGLAGRRGTRRARVATLVGSAVLLLAATGCVLDITNDVGGAQPLAINDRGVYLAFDEVTRELVKIEQQGGPKQVLRQLPGETLHVAEFINNDGYVAGWAGTTAADHSWSRSGPVVWQPDGTPIDLRPYLEGGDHPRFSAHPLGLNSRGQVLGYVNYRTGTGSSTTVWQGFVWDLATRSTTYLPERAIRSTTGSINDRGDIIGHNGYGPFRLTPQVDGSYTDAGWEALPLFPAAINNVGDIVGTLAPDYRTAAVLPAGRTTTKTLADPGLPAGELSPRYFINDSGMIVISKRMDSFEPAGLPVRYKNAGSEPERFPGLHESPEANVVDLNNNGRVIGYAKGADGITRPFSWTE